MCCFGSDIWSQHSPITHCHLYNVCGLRIAFRLPFIPWFHRSMTACLIAFRHIDLTQWPLGNVVVISIAWHLSLLYRIVVWLLAVKLFAVNATKPRWWKVNIQYIPRNMHTLFALLCFVVVIHWLVFPYPSGLLHWHCGNLPIAPVPAKQPWWIWINTSCEFIMNDCITTTKQSTTKPCAYFLGYTVGSGNALMLLGNNPLPEPVLTQTF